MIIMEILDEVRRMHVRDKLSVRRIAKRTRLSRNKPHKWLRTAEVVRAPKYVKVTSWQSRRVCAGAGASAQG